MQAIVIMKIDIEKEYPQVHKYFLRLLEEVPIFKEDYEMVLDIISKMWLNPTYLPI